MYWQETQSLESISTQKLMHSVENDTIEGTRCLFLKFDQELVVKIELYVSGFQDSRI